MRRSHFAVIAMMTFVPVGAAEDTLASRLEAITLGPDYKQAHWGMLIVDAETGKTVYEYHPDQLFAPASTTKLYTCANALVALGPDYKFETPVYRSGEVKDGRLDGDLVLVASGDLTMGGRTGPDGTMRFADSDHTYAAPTSTATAVTDTDPLAGLKSLAEQVRKAGITRIRDVLIDTRLFPQQRGSGSGPDMLTPIVINDNVIDVIVEPASEVGKRATIRLRQQTEWVQQDGSVETVAKGTVPSIETASNGKHRFSVYGRIAVDSKPMVRIWPVDDPAAFARALFIQELQRAGVATDANLWMPLASELPSRNAYEKMPRVALFTSPPLSELTKVTLKVSHNLYASTLPILVGAKSGSPSIAGGLRTQRRFLLDLGVPVETISFAGGAGGAQADAVTPRATVKLLQVMQSRKEYAAWHNGFPILGVDGTLADVVGPDSPAKGKVQAKTGTLSWFDTMNGRTLLRSKALAGTMTTASGKKLILAMFVNDVPLPPGVTATREGRTIGRICEIVYQHGP